MLENDLVAGMRVRVLSRYGQLKNAFYKMRLLTRTVEPNIIRDIVDDAVDDDDVG